MLLSEQWLYGKGGRFVQFTFATSLDNFSDLFSFPHDKYYSQSFYDNVNAVNMTVFMVLIAFNGSYLR